jgi:hypothetical protein
VSDGGPDHCGARQRASPCRISSDQNCRQGAALIRLTQATGARRRRHRYPHCGRKRDSIAATIGPLSASPQSPAAIGMRHRMRSPPGTSTARGWRRLQGPFARCPVISAARSDPASRLVTYERTNADRHEQQARQLQKTRSARSSCSPISLETRLAGTIPQTGHAAGGAILPVVHGTSARSSQPSDAIEASGIGSTGAFRATCCLQPCRMRWADQRASRFHDLAITRP